MLALCLTITKTATIQEKTSSQKSPRSERRAVTWFQSVCPIKVKSRTAWKAREPTTKVFSRPRKAAARMEARLT